MEGGFYTPQNGPRNGDIQALGEDAIAAGRRLYVEGAVVLRSGGSAIERLREGLEGYDDIPTSFDLGKCLYGLLHGCTYI